MFIDIEKCEIISVCHLFQLTRVSTNYFTCSSPARNPFTGHNWNLYWLSKKANTHLGGLSGEMQGVFVVNAKPVVSAKPPNFCFILLLLLLLLSVSAPSLSPSPEQTLWLRNPVSWCIHGGFPGQKDEVLLSLRRRSRVA